MLLVEAPCLFLQNYDSINVNGCGTILHVFLKVLGRFGNGFEGFLEDVRGHFWTSRGVQRGGDWGYGAGLAAQELPGDAARASNGPEMGLKWPETLPEPNMSLKWPDTVPKSIQNRPSVDKYIILLLELVVLCPKGKPKWKTEVWF